MDLDKITHLDVGCGPAGQRIAWWLDQGIDSCLGVDTDLSESNEDCEFLKRALALHRDHEHIRDRIATCLLEKGIERIPRDDEVLRKLVQEDAFGLVGRIPSDQLEIMCADYFFNNLEKAQYREFFDSAQRVLRPDGRLIVTCEQRDVPFLRTTSEDSGLKLEGVHTNYELVTNDLRMRRLFEPLLQKENVQVEYCKN